MKVHQVKHAGQFNCQRGCKAAFLTFWNLDDHIKCVHSQNKPEAIHEFKCNECGEIFDAKIKLRQHCEKKHATKQFACDYCRKVFSSQNVKNEHMNNCNEWFKNVKNKATLL